MLPESSSRPLPANGPITQLSPYLTRNPRTLATIEFVNRQQRWGDLAPLVTDGLGAGAGGRPGGDRENATTAAVSVPAPTCLYNFNRFAKVECVTGHHNGDCRQGEKGV